jgi:hypothetical protein
VTVTGWLIATVNCERLIAAVAVRLVTPAVETVNCEKLIEMAAVMLLAYVAGIVIEPDVRFTVPPVTMLSEDRFTSAPDVPTVQYIIVVLESYISAYPAVPVATAVFDVIGVPVKAVTPDAGPPQANVPDHDTKSVPVAAVSPVAGIAPE